MPIANSRELPCRRCGAPEVYSTWSDCRCRSGLYDANSTSISCLPIVPTKSSPKFRQECREAYAARLQELRQDQLAAQEALATKQREWLEIQARIKRDYEIAKAELQQKVEECENSFRLREEQIMSSGRFEVRGTVTQQSAESKKEDEQHRELFCESSNSTMEATKTTLQSGQDNPIVTTSGVGAGVDSNKPSAGKSTSVRTFAGVSRNDTDLMSTLGETTCRGWEAAKTTVSSLSFTLTPTVHTCVNDNDTHKSISSSCNFANESSSSRNIRSASKTNVVESCLRDMAAQLEVEFDGLVSSKKLVLDQLMLVNRVSGKQKLSCQQKQRSIPERAFQDRDTQRFPGPRNQQLLPLQDTGSRLVVCSMTPRERLNPKGKPLDEPMFIRTSITIGRRNEYSGAENFGKKRKLVGQPEQNERRMSSSMQREGMCGVSVTWHELLDKLFVLKIVLPNPCNSLKTVAQQILRSKPCLFTERWEIDWTLVELFHRTWDKSMFIRGMMWFSGVTAGRMMFPLPPQENNQGFTKAINQQYSRKTQSVVEAFVEPEVQQEIVRLWFNNDSGMNQVGVPKNAVLHSSAKIGDGELGQSGSYWNKTLLGQRLPNPRQEKIQWFQIDPGGKSTSVADSSSTKAMQP